MEEYRSGHNEAVLKTVWVKAHGGSNPSSSANKTDKPFACPFCLMHYVRGIRTRALRKRHSASFLAAARRLLQSIKTADQGCFAKDKNESLFLRQAKRTSIFCLSVFVFRYLIKGILHVALHRATYACASAEVVAVLALSISSCAQNSGHIF